MSNTWLVIIIAVLCLGLGGIGTHYWIDKQSAPVSNTVVIHDTTTQNQIKFKNVIVEGKASIKQLDSLAQVALTYWLNHVSYVHDTLKQQFGSFHAEFDSTLKSPDTLTTIKIHDEIASRIPIDPLIKFYNDYTITTKPKVITMNTYNPGFFDRFNWVLFAGAGYDPFTRSANISIGLGIGINFKQIF